MENFLKVNSVENVDSMYGKEVYVTLFPDKAKEQFIYKGRLLGYGAYGTNPEHKTFCVHVDRGDRYQFIDYFRDGCFRSKDEYEDFKRRRKEKCPDGYTVSRLASIMENEEKHIEVHVKVGNMVYPVNGIADQAASIKIPAFVLKADMKNGKEWSNE